MKKKAKTIIAVLVITFIVALIGGVLAYNNIQGNLNKLSYMKMSTVDISTISNGTYSGSYKVFPISVKLNVTINNRKITKIDLIKHVNGQGDPAEKILNKVIEVQNLQVDSISGATYSSKVILKAVENALSSASK